jgi:zinc transporter
LLVTFRCGFGDDELQAAAATVTETSHGDRILGDTLLIPETTYGSDEVGLVCGYVFEPGEPGEPLSAEEAIALAAQAEAGSEPRDRFVWLHFNISNVAAEPWLREHLALPETFYELTEGSGSTRVEAEEGALVAVVHDVLFEFDYDAFHVSMVRLTVRRGFLVSARSKPLRSIDRLRAAVRAGETFRSSVHLLSHLLHLQADVLAHIVREATIRTDKAEDNVLASRIRTSREDLGRLRRVLVRLQRLLAPEPAALYRLLSRPPAWIEDADVQDLRAAAEEFSAAITDAGALVERVKLVQEELAALIGEQNNRSLFILTIVTVLALPFNVIAGLFGMNVGGIPFAAHESGFWWIVAVLTSFTGAAAWVSLRRR